MCTIGEVIYVIVELTAGTVPDLLSWRARPDEGCCDETMNELLVTLEFDALVAGLRQCRAQDAGM